MTKKVRFPLEMEQGVEVRSVEELRENFSLPRVLAYVEDGKLVTWLKDRYEDELAEAVEQLSMADRDLPQKVCEIFDVVYEKQDAEILEEVERNRKLRLLKKYTEEQKYCDLIDSIAFDQEDLYDLLDAGEEKIYLCGDRFSIPLGKKGMRYIGINNPIAVIDAKEPVNWREKNISIEGMEFDKKYKSLLGADEVKSEEGVYQEYVGFSEFNTYLSSSQQEYAKELYKNFSMRFHTLEFDFDNKNMKSTIELIKGADLCGAFENYEKRL